jgi:hypothetical protein
VPFCYSLIKAPVLAPARQPLVAAPVRFLILPAALRGAALALLQAQSYSSHRDFLTDEAATLELATGRSSLTELQHVLAKVAHLPGRV